MGADALLLQSGPTLATTVRGAGIAIPAYECKKNVGRQKEIAHIVEREDAEHDIKHSTDSTKPQKVKKGIGGMKATEGVVDGSHTNNDDGPHGTDK